MFMSVPCPTNLLYTFVETGYIIAICGREYFLFKGLGPTLVGVVPARSINFFTYGNGEHTTANKFNDAKENSYVYLAAASFARIVTGTGTNPIWVVKTWLQFGQGDKKVLGGGSWLCIKKIMREEGINMLGSAGTAKFLASHITYLHEVLRTRIRQPTVNGVLKYSGLWHTLRLVIAYQGARSLYGGPSAHLMRVVPNAAVIYSIYEGFIIWGSKH